jgi:hypothetical protein
MYANFQTRAIRRRISAGDRLLATPREELAQTIWAEVAD